MSGARGQASVEYVAVVALVAIVLTAAVALTSGGLGDAIVGALQSGLCRVTGDTCPAPARPVADLPPCPVRDDSSEFGAALDVVVTRLGRGLGMRTVRYSDGHVEVSFADTRSRGLHVGLGARLEVAHVGVGAAATAGVDWSVTAGHTWRFASRAAADRFVRRYGARVTPLGSALDSVRRHCAVCRLAGWEPAPLPPADATSYARGTGVRIEATALGGLLASGVVDLNRQLLGSTIARDGTRAVYLSTTDGLRASTLAGFGASSEVAHTGAVELDLDGDGPTAIVLHGVRRDAAGLTGATGRVEESDVRLADPTRADVRGVRFLLARRPPDPGSFADLEALLGHVRRAGVVTARTYALSSGGGEVGGEIDAGVGVGLDVDHAHARLRLLAATTRVPGLPALPRDDCRAPGI